MIGFNAANACSCQEFKKFDIWDYLDYTSIVKGEVISVEQHPDSFLLDTIRNIYFKFGGYQIIQVRVSEVYKGDCSDIMTYKAKASDGISCSVNINVGESWYIFSNIVQGENYIGGCSWSRKTNSNLKYIKHAIKLSKQLSSIDGEVIEKKYRDKDCSKKRSARGLLANGQAQGYWEFLDKKGNPYMTGYYVNGVPDSVWIDYFRDIHECATNRIASRTYYCSQGSASVSYSWEDELFYGYITNQIQIPDRVFSSDEIQYLKNNAKRY